jgi:UrcA family protein
MKAPRKLTMATAVFAMLLGTGLQANAATTTKITGQSLSTRAETTVSVADINLTSAAGQKVLHARLSRASEQVCGYDDYIRAGSFAIARRNKECTKNAIDRAMSRLNASAVAAVE